MAFLWLADDGPFIVVFWSSIPSPTKKNIQKKRYQIWTLSDKTTWAWKLDWLVKHSQLKRTRCDKWIEWNFKWAVTCDFQQCGILTSVDSDEPVQPPFKLRNSKWCLLRICKQLAKVLIRLRICAGWSEALLVAHTTLLEISCRGSNDFLNLWYC